MSLTVGVDGQSVYIMNTVDVREIDNKVCVSVCACVYDYVCHFHINT